MALNAPPPPSDTLSRSLIIFTNFGSILDKKAFQLKDIHPLSQVNKFEQVPQGRMERVASE